MSVKDQIVSLFLLENNLDLFQIAITPKSCGGSDKFKYYALIGDKILDLGLVQILAEIYGFNSGILTIESKKIHNERTLFKLCQKLGIIGLLHPINNQPISMNDTKETIESLLGVSFEVNGIDSSIEVVEKLVSLILDFETEEDTIIDENYIGITQEYFQKRGENEPQYEFSENLGLSHKARFWCRVTASLNGEELNFKSGEFKSKSHAKRDATALLLRELGVIEEGVLVQPEILEEKIELRAKSSLEDKTIVFENPDKERTYQSMQLSTNTGESIVEWAKKKAEKKPYSMFLLLSARVDDISGNSWVADIDGEHLVLLHMKMKKKLYFAIGFGESKSKARKDAAWNLIEKIKLYDLLEEYYPNFMI